MTLLSVRTVKCRVERCDALNASVTRLVLQGPSDIRHAPGQYLELGVVVDGQPRWLPFSIANACQHDGMLELHLQYVPDSAALVSLWSSLIPGAVLDVRLPKGSCVLETDDNAPLMLIAAGTGFAQMKAIIEAALMKDPTRNIELWWGGSTSDALYLDSLARGWMQDYLNFTYYPVIEHANEKNSDGVIARIDHALAQHVTHFSHYSIFLSGSPGMVYGVVDTLEQIGPLTERIFSDVFSYAPRY